MITPLNFRFLASLPSVSKSNETPAEPLADDGVLFASDGGGDVDGEGHVDLKETISAFAKKFCLKDLLGNVENGVPINGNGDKKVDHKVATGRQVCGYKTPEDARASLTGFPADLIDKYYDIVEDNGQYYADPKAGVTISYSEQANNSYHMGIGEDGTKTIIPRTDIIRTYTIKNADGTSVKIQNGKSLQATTDGYPNTLISYYDKNGNLIIKE